MKRWKNIGIIFIAMLSLSMSNGYCAGDEIERNTIVAQENFYEPNEADDPEIRRQCYERLGVPQTSTDQQVEKAYKRLARRWHPDKNHGNEKEAEEQFKAIGQAYDRISNKNFRPIDASEFAQQYQEWLHEQAELQKAIKKEQKKRQARIKENEKYFFLTAAALIATTATGVYLYKKIQLRKKDIEDIKKRTDLTEQEKEQLIKQRSRFFNTYLPNWLFKLWGIRTDWSKPFKNKK